MQPTFVITNPLQQLPLEQGKGELTWTVSNTTSHQVRGRLDLDIDIRQGIDPGWFTIEEPKVRVFGPNETIAVNVAIEVPADTDEQQPRVSLTASNVERPQEDYQIGPAVSVRDLHWTTGPKPKPFYKRWWFIVLMISILLGLIGGGVGLALYLGSRDPLAGKTLTEALTYVHSQNLDLGEIQWSFDPTIREKRILPSGTVLKSEIIEGEASLVIQLWHTYDTQDKLGFTRKQRAENVEMVKKRVPILKKNPLPLNNWLQFEDEEALTTAKEDAVPVEFYAKEYQVGFDDTFKVSE